MPLTPKRKAIEKRLGRPLWAYLRARFLKNAGQREVARELGMDHATIRYYIKKWDLPYSPRLRGGRPKAIREKERKEAKIKSKPMPRTHRRKQIEQGLGHVQDRLGRALWEPKPMAKEAKIKRGHIDVCMCAIICKYRSCEEAKESHKRGRCVLWCRSFKGRATGLTCLGQEVKKGE